MTLYAGLFLVTLSTLVYEILLTRIFSVTMWYHFAFMAISTAMFGLTLGAVLVYLRPERFTPARTARHLAGSAWWLAVSTPASFAVQVLIPVAPGGRLADAARMALLYAVVSVPFVFAGVTVCLALTRFPERVGRLYAADLAGAALGCVALVGILRVTDGPTAVLVVALSASLGALLFARFAGDRRLVRRALAGTAVLAVFVAGHTWLVHRGEPWLRLTWIKGAREPRPLYERWNSFSYIRVKGDPRRSAPPVGWGLSPAYPPDRTVGELFLDIDASAMTILTRADGRPGALMHLTHNVTSLAHYVRRDARVLIVGSGGGRDVLTALAFDQRSVLALEINQDILATVNGRFGAYTGPLDRDPRVTFVNDEARSWLARSRAEFDIIQASLVDTWAATAAGAFVLTEHALYTLEAFDVFLDRLAPDGILTMTRWYFRDAPGETYRLTALAQAALRRRGVADPRRHLVVARKLGERPGDRDAPEGLGTLLVGKRPFSPEEVGVIQRVTRDLGFELMLAPSSAADPVLATLAGAGADAVIAGFPLDISPPTDDRPFFFHMLRLRDVLRGGLRGQGLMTSNLSAVETLGVLLLVVVTLTALAIVVPLLLTTGTGALRGSGLPVLFFAGIGFGFMLVEVSQMQRLVIFLGHPTYGLSVVLFALLLAGGLGSYWTEARGAPPGPRGAAARLGVLLLVLGVFGAATPAVIAAFQAATTPLRIAVAVAMLLPVGFCLGTALPLGLGLASRRWASITPWLWGINGATSVCASVLAVAISMTAGIAAAFWTGFGCYVVATLAYLGAARRAGPLSACEVLPGGTGPRPEPR